MARKDKQPLGIYVHVPFCRSKCEYCDFYSLAQADSRLTTGYLDAVCAHIREAARLAPAYEVDTVYFGGGTPSFLGPDALCAILNTVRRHFDMADDAEITFEANPDSVTPRLLRRLKSEGVNRVSLGIQCDDDHILRAIGRPHTYADAVNAVKRIRKAGFQNLSVDLIYGLPEQSLAMWEATLRNVLALEPEHISCYGLKLEEGTPLFCRQETLQLPDDDTQADMYLSAVEYLRLKGYRQYEISNFAKRGKESRHNIKYWLGDAYLGFGPAASSDFAGKRFTAVRDLKQYVSGILEGGRVLEDVQEVPLRERAGEYLMMRLRTAFGIVAEEYERQFLLPFAPLEAVLQQCRSRHHAEKSAGGRWCLTPEGMLVSNAILSDLLLVQDGAAPLAKRR